MRCSKCGFENPEGINFCGQCTNALALVCPRCHFENPPGFKFCGQCTTPLRAPATAAAGIAGDRTGPLFRTTVRRTGVLTDRRMTQSDAWRMVQRRARDAGIPTAVCNHSFRATGITASLDNGGSLENAQAMAAYESPRTTKLYDRTDDQITLDEVEKVGV